MKKSLQFVLFFALTMATAEASSTSECKTSLREARASLVDMVAGKKDSAQQKLVKDTAEKAQSCLMGLKPPKGSEALLEQLKTTWKDFRNTRETQLVPAILSGSAEEARVIATGVQKERMDKMNGILDKLSGSDL